MHGMYGYGGHQFFPWGGLIMGLLFLVLVVLALVVIVRLSRHGSRASGPIAAADLGKALEILAERFARGEIDAEAYRTMKAELEKK